MNTRTIAAEYRLQHWARIIQECKGSGLSIRAYCKNAGFHENRFFYWQKKLREATCEELANTNVNKASLTPICSGNRTPVIWAGISKQGLTAVSTPTNSNIRISRDGWTVTVEAGFDSDLLTEALRAVSRACC